MVGNELTFAFSSFLRWCSVSYVGSLGLLLGPCARSRSISVDGGGQRHDSSLSSVTRVAHKGNTKLILI